MTMLMMIIINSFLTSSKHVYTTWGSAISKSLSTFTNPSQHIQESYLTAYELIRFGVLHAKPYSKVYSKHVTEGIYDLLLLLFMKIGIYIYVYEYLLNDYFSFY